MSEPAFSLEELLDQEQRLQFHGFDNDRAIALGLRLIDRARAGGHALTIDVMRCGHQLFHAALPGTAADNDRWVERKRAVVERFGHSSLFMRQSCEREGTTLAGRYQLDPLRFAASGGSFPVQVRGVGLVGSVTVSGLPHEDDHRLVVEAVAAELSAAERDADPPVALSLAVGDEVVLQRQVTPADIDAFADLSGDHSPNHVDAAAMAGSPYGERIAHGALLVALISACSTAIVERVPQVRSRETPVSLGYDRIRFLRPVYPGDQLTLRYTVTGVDPVRRRSRAAFAIQGADGQLACVGDHLIKWVPGTGT